MQRADSLENTSEAGKDWRQEKGTTGDKMVVWHHWVSGMSLSKLWEMVKTGKPCVLQPMGLQRVGHNLVTEQQQIQQI